MIFDPLKTWMRSACIVAAFSIATSVYAAEPNTLTESEKAEGWRLLFDGKTTAGWVAIGKTQFPEKGWSVVDGALQLEKRGGGGDIVTKELFTDFELTWEWKIGEGGNSGVKYNLLNPAKAVGFEYQLLDDQRHPDGLVRGRSRRTSALYDLIEPAADIVLNPVGEWNTSKIVVRGNVCEHWLNGKKSVETEIGSTALKDLVAASKYKKAEKFGEKATSPILLQDHGDFVAIRSIKVRTPAK